MRAIPLQVQLNIAESVTHFFGLPPNLDVVPDVLGLSKTTRASCAATPVPNSESTFSFVFFGLAYHEQLIDIQVP